MRRGSVDATPAVGYAGNDQGIGTLAGRGITFYNYGYPAYGPVQSNVTAQWLFDESSGDLVDEVAALTLADAGSPTYGVTASGAYNNLSPGIQGAVNARFSIAGAQSAVEPGTGDATFEWWTLVDATVTNNVIIETFVRPSFNGFNLNYTNTPRISFYSESSTGEAVSANFDFSYADPDPSKGRLIWNRTAATLELKYNGSSKGSVSIAGQAAKTIGSGGVSVFSTTDPTDYFTKTCFEMRFSKNATNNSGGRGGG